MHTPAYENSFGPNTEKLRSLLGFLHRGVESYLPELKAFWPKLNALKAAAPVIDQKDRLLAESREIAEELAKQKSEREGGVATIHGLMAVFFVAIVEAYWKDVLIYAAEMDSSLMEQSEQTASHKQLLKARGPEGWMKSLEAMGARGYRPNTLALMERLWGVRHLIVHSAGIVTPEFVRRHSHFQKKIGDHFIVTNNHLTEWLAGIYDFVEVTDSFFVKRCAAKTEGR